MRYNFSGCWQQCSKTGSSGKKIITLEIGIEKKYTTRDRAGSGLKTHTALEHWLAVLLKALDNHTYAQNFIFSKRP
jgi:hypothetical protein